MKQIVVMTMILNKTGHIEEKGTFGRILSLEMPRIQIFKSKFSLFFVSCCHSMYIRCLFVCAYECVWSFIKLHGG